jgi:hypothetical protein
MRQIRIKIKSASGGYGLLMHNPQSMSSSRGGGRQQIPTAEEEAAASCYWVDGDKSSLALPGIAFHRCVLRASSKYRLRKTTFSSLFCSSVHIEPELISLNTSHYEINTMSAVVQRQRILRSRAEVRNWTAELVMHFDEEWLPVDAMEISGLQIIKDAGKLVGLLDYRPEKKGPYGTFSLVDYELLPQRQVAEETPVNVVGFDYRPSTAEPLSKKKRERKVA